MIVRCPACGFRGNLRVPDHVPRGKSVRIRCARCRTPFSLNVDRLFPQNQEQGYAAIVPESRPCRGERLGNLWVEVTGTPTDRAPLLALPAHPAFSHDILHDLLDGFGEYFQVCYVEFPGSGRHPAAVQSVDYAAWLSDSLPALKQRLGAAKVHLLAHLASAPAALRVAVESPDEIASLTLLEPDLCLAQRLRGARHAQELAAFRDGHLEGLDREDLTLAVLGKLWRLPLEQEHIQGLARILAAGLAPEMLRRDLRECRGVAYRSLARLQVPVLLFTARDQPDRGEALYLQATLPAVETADLEKGGAMAPWFGSSWFAGKLQAFKRSADPAGPGAGPPPGQGGAGRAARAAGPPRRRRSQTLNGQPAGWLLLLYALLACGLNALAARLPFQPEYLRWLLPQSLAGLLPILWLLVPRRINPFGFLRFRGLSPSTTLLPLAAGAMLGLAFRGLLGALPALTNLLNQAGVPVGLAGRLIGPAPGDPGRLVAFIAAGAAALLVWGAAANLLVMRRSSWAVLLPALVFALFPAQWPDVIWRLPTALLASLLFARSLSVFAPLFLLAGVALGWQLPQLQPVLALADGQWQLLASAAGLACAAVLLVVLLGGRGRPIRPERRYYADTLNRPGAVLRWDPGLGVVLVVFSTLAAAAAVFVSLAA